MMNSLLRLKKLIRIIGPWLLDALRQCSVLCRVMPTQCLVLRDWTIMA